MLEELGLQLSVGRLLCIEWQGPEPDRSESLMVVYDGGVLPASAEIRLPPEELKSHRFVERDEIGELTVARLARRTAAALRALDEGILVELEWGKVLGAPEPGWPGRDG